MTDPIIFRSSPEKFNIKYHVHNVKSMNISKIFHYFYENMVANGYKAQKVLVFCRQRKDLGLIYQYFDNSLEHLYNNYKVRPYAMFHSETEEDIRNHVRKEFTDTNVSVRFLVAAVAFGMGVDCKGLNLVIHYGAAASISDYFQESGRAGRDRTSLFYAIQDI